MAWGNHATFDTLAARWGATSPDDGAFPGLQTIMSSAEHIYGIADNHAQTVQVCIDRLHDLGANEQLKRLTGRLQKLAVRARPRNDDKDTKAARRQRG